MHFYTFISILPPKEFSFILYILFAHVIHSHFYFLYVVSRRRGGGCKKKRGRDSRRRDKKNLPGEKSVTRYLSPGFVSRCRNRRTMQNDAEQSAVTMSNVASFERCVLELVRHFALHNFYHPRIVRCVLYHTDAKKQEGSFSVVAKY